MTRKEWVEANQEKVREYRRRYRESHREEIAEKNRVYKKKVYQRDLPKKLAWAKAHRFERRAQHQAAWNIPLKEACEICGEKATDRHHPDHSVPLVVVHLCKSCHMKIQTRRRK